MVDLTADDRPYTSKMYLTLRSDRKMTPQMNLLRLDRYGRFVQSIAQPNVRRTRGICSPRPQSQSSDDGLGEEEDDWPGTIGFNGLQEALVFVVL